MTDKPRAPKAQPEPDSGKAASDQLSQAIAANVPTPGNEEATFKCLIYEMPCQFGW